MNTSSSWNPMRIIRVLAGTGLIIYGISINYYLLSFLGGFLLLQGILNLGCCMTSSCSVTKENSKEEEISYEEVSPK
jgi:hypothetical protein